MRQVFACTSASLFQPFGASMKEKEMKQLSFNKICILQKEKNYLVLFYSIVVGPDDNQKERMEFVAEMRIKKKTYH